MSGRRHRWETPEAVAVLARSPETQKKAAGTLSRTKLHPSRISMDPPPSSGQRIEIEPLRSTSQRRLRHRRLDREPLASIEPSQLHAQIAGVESIGDARSTDPFGALEGVGRRGDRHCQRTGAKTLADSEAPRLACASVFGRPRSGLGPRPLGSSNAVAPGPHFVEAVNDRFGIPTRSSSYSRYMTAGIAPGINGPGPAGPPVSRVRS